LDDLRYPIGQHTRPERLTPDERAAGIAAIAAVPAALRRAVEGLADARLDTPYRPGGWTVRQVVHHLADAHTNAYIRFKLGLTEDAPTIRQYEEQLWAELPEAKGAPIVPSLALLEAVHVRWVMALSVIRPDQWPREFIHPVTGRHSLDQLLAVCVWHGRHHVAQVAELRRREGW
jgi:uncharacterized damage-inducible protein DinB